MIVSPDKSGKIDPVWFSLLKEVKSHLPIVPITKIEGYEFNEGLKGLDKWILVCGSEYGWNFPLQEKGTHQWGFSVLGEYNIQGEQWERFNDFVASNPPVIVFKRELMMDSRPENYYPINYPCWHQIPPLQSKQEFNERVLQVNNIWGLSHEYRKTLHAQIWQKAGDFGYVVCDNVSNLEQFLYHESNPRKWLTANVPWYARHDMSRIIQINGASKISISIGGAGRHCFRDEESPINSVMYRWEDGIEFSYPWINNVNCIKSTQGYEILTIIEALDNPNLYDIYCEGVANCEKYFLPNYVKNYIEPIINAI